MKSVAVISKGLGEKEERERSDLGVPRQVRRRSRQTLEEVRRTSCGGDDFILAYFIPAGNETFP